MGPCLAIRAETPAPTPPSPVPGEEARGSLSLFDLPIEIRLQIYHWVHLSSPVLHRQLAPWYPIPTCRSHIAQPVVPEADDGRHDEEKTTAASTGTTTTTGGGSTTLLAPDRPFARMPTALLRTCRQANEEARGIPFHENEFVFINWFSSGLTSALAFTRARHPWQRQEMRFVRLEVFARDVAGAAGGARARDWAELCGMWTGLRGLRLTVWMEGGKAYYPWKREEEDEEDEEDDEDDEDDVNHNNANDDNEDDHDGGEGRRRRRRRRSRGGGEEEGRRTGKEDGREGDPWELVGEDGRRTGWAGGALGRLKELRQLEVEMADVRWPAGDKVRWCERLRETVVRGGGRRELRVVCVEKRKEGMAIGSDGPV